MESYPELQKFLLHDVKRTGVRLGAGSYGEVEELCWSGTKCAGKCLHETLLDYNPGISSIMTTKFISECKMIAKIRHPNVVQFLGLWFFLDYKEQKRLYLVMEKLNDDLSTLLDHKPNIQLPVKCSILLDISRGLVHLHGHDPPITHRDLSTRNILLTASMQAKIADLGTARMIGSHRMQHTPMPGAPPFMPPEANAAEPKYDSKLDIFSFGHVMLHTLIQVNPCDLLAPTYQTPAGKIKGRSEEERRGAYLQILYGGLKKEHPLSKLTVQCLKNEPKRRPAAKEAMKILEDFHLELENAGEKYNAFSKMTDIIQDKHGKTMERKEGEDIARGQWDVDQRTRSTSFIESHILKGHPGVLKIYQQGGMFRRNAEWKEFVFKIAEGKLQYYGLNKRLQGELPLAKVETAKGFWSPNTTELFPFHVHFNGRGTPWILGAHSNEERQSWMEAIKPGSTLNQWVRPNIKNPAPHPPTIPPSSIKTTSEETPPPIPPRPWAPPDPSSKSSSGAALGSDDGSNLTPKVPPRPEFSFRMSDDNPAEVSFEVPPRPDFTSQTSDCTYVPVHMLNTIIAARNKEENPETGGDDRPPKNFYLPIVDKTEEDNSVLGGLEERIIKELSEQFEPVQIDLLLQMFKTWLNNPEQQQQEQQQPRLGRSTSTSSTTLSVTNEPVEPVCPLSRRHVGYAKEGHSDPYQCLADIALELNSLKSGKREKFASKKRETEGESSKRHAIYVTLGDLLEGSSEEEAYDETSKDDEVFSSLGSEVDPSSSLSKLTRSNAVVRSTVRGCRSSEESTPEQESSSVQRRVKQRKPKQPAYEKPVSTLRTLLKQASTEDMLEDSESDCPEWFKASTEVMSPSQAPKPNRMSTYCSNTEYDLFLSQEDLVDFQQIAEGQFGPVYRANRATQNVSVPVALKPIKCVLLTETDVSKFLKEVSILKCIRHPNIAQVYGLVDQANWIVMEYLPNGDLKNYLIYKKHTISQLMKYMLDISMGMHYLSAKGFVHRKLAARNILVSENESCKVADLDLGSHSQWTEEETVKEGTQDPNKILRWLAPEILLHRIFSTASDVWSYGIVLWEMFNPTQLPYQECDDGVCVERIAKGFGLGVPRQCPQRVGKIMKACWYLNPASRPSFLYISSLLNSIMVDYNAV